MDRQSETSRVEEQAPGESFKQVTRNRSLPSQPRYLLVAWILLLLLGALFLIIVAIPFRQRARSRLVGILGADPC